MAFSAKRVGMEPKMSGRAPADTMTKRAVTSGKGERAAHHRHKGKKRFTKQPTRKTGRK